jgi:hypothetical protein
LSRRRESPEGREIPLPQDPTACLRTEAASCSGSIGQC